jgi:cell division protein FtsN
MQKSEKFFIFSWKELLVIALLVLTIVGFFFTLGLHYGKKIHPETVATEAPAGKLEESPDAVPAKEDLAKGGQNAEPAAQDAIQSATESAVADSKLKVDAPRPVDLPEETKPSKKAVSKVEAQTSSKEKIIRKAPTKESAKESIKESTDESRVEKPGIVSTTAESKESHFAVQLGSYTSKKEALQKVGIFSKRGIKTEIRTADVNGETRYRIVIPGFKTKGSADLRGKSLRITRKIENFVTIKSE